MGIYDVADVKRDRFRCTSCNGSGSESRLRSYGAFSASTSTSCYTCFGYGHLRLRQVLINSRFRGSMKVINLVYNEETVGFRIVYEFGFYFGNRKVFDCELSALTEGAVTRLNARSIGVEHLVYFKDKLLTQFEIDNEILVENITDNASIVSFIISQSY